MTCGRRTLDKRVIRTLAGSGFTLLEVMLAIILSLGAFWCIDAYAKGMLAVSESEGRFTSMNLAQEKTEQVRRMAYSQITNANLPPENPVPGFSAYQRSVNVTTNPSNRIPPNSTYKTVDVTVTWQMPRGGAQSFAIRSYAADY